ncbi:MAG TPA: response regulator [Xanthobacteraceae bacterium]
MSSDQGSQRSRPRPADTAARSEALTSSKVIKPTAAGALEKLVQTTQVLIVEDNQYMRKVVRNLLMNIGVKNIHEAADGVAGLEAIRLYAPDLIILDWEMPLLDGAELVRIVRSPGVFPLSDVPIIMLTAHVERWRVLEATRLGVNEFLKKPVSAKSLMERIVAILTKPRKMVRIGDYYGPEPRKLFTDAADRLGAMPPPPSKSPAAAPAAVAPAQPQPATAAPAGAA